VTELIAEEKRLDNLSVQKEAKLLASEVHGLGK